MLSTHKESNTVNIQFTIHTCLVLVLQLRWSKFMLYKADKSYYSCSMSLCGGTPSTVGCGGYLPSQRQALDHLNWDCWLILLDQHYLHWRQLFHGTISLCAAPKQKMEISAALAHSSIFEADLTVMHCGCWENRVQMVPRTALTVVLSFWSLAP